MSTHTSVEVAIVGGGLVGLSLVRAVMDAGLTVAIIDPQSPRRASDTTGWDNRIFAVSPGSASFLSQCGVWERLPQDRVTRVEAMRVYGDDASACLAFSAYDAGLRELAFIVENDRLQQALWEGVQDQNVIHRRAGLAALELQSDCAALHLDDGTVLEAGLVVGADGAESRVRACAGIGVAPRDYGQVGLVANFSCAKSHGGTAFQWFSPDGVVALLPLPGNRVSMVWSIEQSRGRDLLALPAAELAAAVESASRTELGALALITPPAAFPLRLQRVKQFVRPRVALVGDAAHNVHPLAGQGVNLGFRDARELARVLRERGPQRDCGDYALLRRYERARREDVTAIELTTDGLQKLFSSDRVWLSRLRNRGFTFVDHQPLLKKFLVHQAVA